MERYKEYKSSSIQWLKAIPSHWSEKKIGSLFFERRQKVSDKDYPPLSVSKQGITPQLETAAKTDNGDNRKLVIAGDFVVNSRSDRKGSCGISSLNGSVSLINIVLQPRGGINRMYFHYLSRSNYYIEEYYRLGRGIVADLWTTRYSELKNMEIPLPPPFEQEKIVSYLDSKTSKIDKYVAEKEREVELLIELKDSEIANVVTRGLNPDVKMKDSGISWIGMIPEHWEVDPFGRHFSYGKGLPITKADLLPEGIAVISYGQIHAKTNSGVTMDQHLIRYVSSSYIGTHPQCLLQQNDFIFADTSEDIEGSGNFAFNDYPDNIFAGYHTLIARPKDLLFPKYYAYLFQSSKWKSQVRSLVNGVKVYTINKRILKNAYILIPSLKEQQDIVAFADSKCAKINSLISDLEAEIEYLKEYKQRLIADCVTGQICVMNK